jgi:hypothetical protein
MLCIISVCIIKFHGSKSHNLLPSANFRAAIYKGLVYFSTGSLNEHIMYNFSQNFTLPIPFCVKLAQNSSYHRDLPNVDNQDRNQLLWTHLVTWSCEIVKVTRRLDPTGHVTRTRTSRQDVKRESYQFLQGFNQQQLASVSVTD